MTCKILTISIACHSVPSNIDVQQLFFKRYLFHVKQKKCIKNVRRINSMSNSLH